MGFAPGEVLAVGTSRVGSLQSLGGTGPGHGEGVASVTRTGLVHKQGPEDWSWNCVCRKFCFGLIVGTFHLLEHS